MSYRDAGPFEGPPVLLLHGLASDGGTWDLAIEPLAARGLRVITPDLLGHGRSDKPDIAYSLASFAGDLRELLDSLGLREVTVVGHSLGGAIAIYLGYHHPGYVARLALVSSGGLGKRVHPLLRAATLPGARHVLAAALNRRTAPVYSSARLHRALRIPPATLVNLSRAGRTLATRDGQVAFFTTLKSVVEPSGQRGSMLEARYLAEHVPVLIVWTEQDHVIPVGHAHRTHQALPNSRLELFPGSSHEPHRRYADRFAEAVAEFVQVTVSTD
jgi:pimeloyl-ACP methyl ester carboxylesterase